MIIKNTKTQNLKKENEMSYLPKFSQKAKKELQRLRLADKRLHGLGSGITNTLDLLPDLFDLEKYPITFDMFFEYINKRSEYNIYSTVEREFVLEFAPEPKFREITVKDDPGSIIKALDFVCGYSNISHIDMIAEIHGWWEQPQTY